ncbi:MAG: T9SS type A sorting domain-containing protein, partial [Ignavibacteria bacterium]|nr:T9SS type A sorting domain-containing protein [Ignavibacteria bacterium]
LSSFNGDTKGRDIKLDWKTSSETNFSRFEVERATVKNATDTKSYKTVTTVKAAGFSNAAKDYSFTDKHLQSGQYTYRLKMINNDGTFEYSNKEVVLSVKAPTTFDLAQNYPNPFNPSTTIEYQLPEDSHVVIELYSVSGERIATLIDAQQEADYHKLVVASSQMGKNLASGMYIYRLVATGNSNQKFVSVKKMMLLK